MEGIYETNEQFPFDSLKCTPPTIIQGGNYFIKYQIDNGPLYIQPPKCTTRQGISKAGKRFYSDLMFTNENAEFIQWMENLENHTCKILYDNREKWFDSEMDLHDIENYFTSPMKLYKSGKFYLTRTTVPTRLGKMTLKVYDENEQDIDIETIRDNTQVITILEIQGIKCSARSFQIEIELKQMMVLKPSNLFERCIIQVGAAGKKNALDNQKIEAIYPHLGNQSQNEEIENMDKDVIVDNIQMSLQEEEEDSFTPLHSSNEMHIATMETDPDIDAVMDPVVDPVMDPDMAEVEFDLDKLANDDTFQIKPRTDVYYEMYKEARRKAKTARNLALNAYLEAKQIKNTYLLDDMNESDESDLDEDDLQFDKDDNEDK